MSHLPPGRARRGTTCLSVLVLLVASCAATGGGAESLPRGPGIETVPSATAGEPDRFSAERALGAQCDPRWIDEPPFQDSACYGLLPDHVADFLRRIPDAHPHLDAQSREEQAGKEQRFRLIEGYGARPDVLAGIHSRSGFWIRSFEGPDPDETVYAVYGPACADDPHGHARSVRDECLPGHPYVVRDLRIYRVRAGATPEDVTKELGPSPPTLTADERVRYGPHLRPPEEGAARDTDIGLDVTRLDQVPVMRWVLRPAVEGDYDAPALPASDPRAFAEYESRAYIAHFGFLVWNGERFEQRTSVPAGLWPCRSVQYAQHVCGAGYEDIADPYLVNATNAQ